MEDQRQNVNFTVGQADVVATQRRVAQVLMKVSLACVALRTKINRR